MRFFQYQNGIDCPIAWGNMNTHSNTSTALLPFADKRKYLSTVDTVKLNALTQTTADGASFIISETSPTENSMTWQLAGGVPTSSNSRSSEGCLTTLTATHAYTLWLWLLLIPSLLLIKQKTHKKNKCLCPQRIR